MKCPYQGKCHSSDYGPDCKYEDNITSCPQYKQGITLQIGRVVKNSYPESNLVAMLNPTK